MITAGLCGAGQADHQPDERATWGCTTSGHAQKVRGKGRAGGGGRVRAWVVGKGGVGLYMPGRPYSWCTAQDGSTTVGISMALSSWYIVFPK